MRSTPGIDLTLRVGRMAHRYGLPAYELDGLLREVAAALRLTANVISTPTFLDCTIDDPHIAEQRRIVEGLDDVSNDLQKLSQTLKLTDRLVAGTVAVDEANRRLDEIEALRPPYPAPVVGVAYAACGAGFAVILSAGWRDVGLAAGLSLIVFILVQASGRSAWLGNRIYVISTFVSSAMAGVPGVVLGESDTNVVALCAFVVLIPGLGSTLGAFELGWSHPAGMEPVHTGGGTDLRPVRGCVDRGDGRPGDHRRPRRSGPGLTGGTREVDLPRGVHGRSRRRVPGDTRSGLMVGCRRPARLRRSRARRSSRRLAGAVPGRSLATTDQLGVQ